MIGASVEALTARAETLAARLGDGVEVVDVRSTIGGGSLPGETLPSVALALATPSATRTLKALRTGTPAVVGRIEADRVVLDLRTVTSAADEALTTAVRAVLR
jgi:L-seryl-tRNA(Ser) seleniumtransferase